MKNRKIADAESKLREEQQKKQEEEKKKKPSL